MCANVHVHEVRRLPGSLSTLNAQLVYPPEFANGVCLASQLDLGISCLCFPSVGSRGGLLHPSAIYMGAGDPNSCPHGCPADTVTTKLPPQPQ